MWNQLGVCMWFISSLPGQRKPLLQLLKVQPSLIHTFIIFSVPPHPRRAGELSSTFMSICTWAPTCLLSIISYSSKYIRLIELQYIRLIELKHFLLIFYPSDFQNVVTRSINRFWCYTPDLLNQKVWRQKLINLYFCNPYKDSVAPKFWQPRLYIKSCSGFLRVKIKVLVMV